jgi:hypothetical protein
MRLEKVETGHRFGKRLQLALIRLLGRSEPYDVVKMLWYRPEVLGGALGRISQAAMRGRSEWSVGERELFAAFVSRMSQCPF